MAANEKFILEFVTKGTQDIDRAKDKIDGVSRAVGGLATTLLGVSFASFISGALQAADRISDFSQATNISIASLKALEAAMNSAGGNGKNLERSINQLYAAIETANGGSLAARDAFAAVGVSLNDLKNTSETDILQKTLEGLAKMPAGAERAAVATQLLGRSFRGIDPAQLLAALDPAKYRESEEATKRAAEAQQRLEESYKALQEGATRALDPILKLFGDTGVSVEQATKLVQGLGIAFGVLFGAQAIASIAAAVSAISKLTTALKATAAAQAFVTALGGPKGIAMVVAASATAGAAIYGLNKILGDTEAQANAASEAVAGVAQAAGVPPGTPQQRIQQATPQAGPANRNQGIDPRQQAQIDSEKRVQATIADIERFRASQSADEIGRIRLERDAEISKASLEILGKEHLTKAQKEHELAIKKVEIETRAEAEIAKVREKQQQQIELVRDIGKEYEKQNRLRIAALDFQTEMVGKSQEERQLAEEQRNLFLDYVNQFDALEKRRISLTKDEKYLNDEIIAQQDSLTTQYYAQAKATTEAVNRLQTANILEKDRQQTLQNIVKLYDDQVARSQKLGEILQGVNNKIFDTQQGPAPAELAGMSAIQKQIEEIKRSTKAAGQEAARAFAQAFTDDGDGLSAERAEEFARGLDQITSAYSRLSEVQEETARRNYEQSRSFETGWKEAYTSYFESAYNAAEQARNIFSTFTRGMEDAIVNFVRTGKLSFKDLANTILEQIIRIQVQRASATLFGGGSAGGGLLGGIFSGIGKIFGFANGGQPPVGRPSLVGERGPELFIPRTAGTIIPNDQLALAGGSSAEPVQITYNIQAVDAASFRSLVARDPQFLFQVTERGRRSQPTRSRV